MNLFFVKSFVGATLLSVSVLATCENSEEEATATKGADYIFNGKIFTAEETAPFVKTVAVKDNKIIAVERTDMSLQSYIGANTRSINLGEKLLVSGFIDGHTHFNRAGKQINDVNLLKVDNNDALKAELTRVINIIGEGEWITGGSRDAYESWQNRSSGEDTNDLRGRWQPERTIIDAITSNNPVFINSFERPAQLYLANTVALKIVGLLENPVAGMDLNPQGVATGLIRKNSPAIELIKSVVAKKSHDRILGEARAALKRPRENGVVEIHDITKTDYEQIYQELQESGEITTRVWMRADLARAAEFNEKKIEMNTHPVTGKDDDYLRWGAYQGYIDGIMDNHSALFFDPYDDRPDEYGKYRDHTSDDTEHRIENMEKMYSFLTEAHRGGYTANVHAIGTRGVSLMLDTYERLQKDLGGSLAGFRVIHCQVVRPQDMARFKVLGVIAEVNPYHVSDDMRWMEERIGHERSKGAYAFRSLQSNGATLVFASDWPGTNAAEY